MTMRLINADDLKKLMEEECAEECAICCYANSGDGCSCNLIDNAPTVEPDMEFAKWVTEMIFGNNKVEDFDFELFSELACRKLEKLGLVKKTESEWIKKGGAE